MNAINTLGNELYIINAHVVLNASYTTINAQRKEEFNSNGVLGLDQMGKHEKK